MERKTPEQPMREQRTPRGQRGQRGRRGKLRVELPVPYDGTFIYIPYPEQCDGSNPRRRTYYCGDKEIIPPGYTRRGTRYECLKKGFGTGNCSIYRQ